MGTCLFKSKMLSECLRRFFLCTVGLMAAVFLWLTQGNCLTRDC